MSLDYSGTINGMAKHFTRSLGSIRGKMNSQNCKYVFKGGYQRMMSGLTQHTGIIYYNELMGTENVYKWA